MNSDEPLSPVPTTAPTATNSPIVLPLTEAGKPPGQWNLTLHPTHLALADSPGGQPYVILREQMMKTAILIEGMKLLVFKQPVKMTFALTPEAVTTLAVWIGKPVLAAYHLKQRYGWVLPAAGLWILASLPMAGDPAAGIPSVPFDPVALILGLTLIPAWAFARWRPNPLLFVLDSIWLIIMTTHLVMGIINGRSKGWLVVALFLLWMIVSGFKHFKRFRGTHIPRLTS